MYTQPDDEQQRTQKAIKDLLLKLNPPKDVATSTESGDVPSYVPGPMPKVMPSPETMGLRSPSNITASGQPIEGLPNGPAPTAPLTPSFNPLDGITAKVPGLPTPAPMNMDRRGVPVPAIEGEKGGPKPYTRERAERFDYYNNGILPPDKMRAAELEYQASQPNNFDSDPNTPGVQPWTLGKRLKAGLKTGVMGALQGISQAAQNPRNNWRGVLAGGVGGFGAGEAAGAINPEAASSWMFNQTQRPALEAEEAKQKADEDRALKREEVRMQIGHVGAQTELNKAQAANLETDNRLADKRFATDAALKRDQLALDRWKAEHQGKTPYRDEKGFARDPVTQAVITDPDTKQPVKLPDNSERFNYSPDYGAYSTKTGKPIPGTASPKLAPADEKALEAQAESYVAKAFPPDAVQSLLKSYSDQAYSSRVTPEDEKQAANYNPEASTKVRQYRAEADKEARAVLERESARWKQLFHDTLRDRAQRGLPPPSGGVATPEQVQQLMREKNLSQEEAVIFLRAFGATVAQPTALPPQSGSQQLFNASKSGWNK